jgi:hypothetical protein
LALDIKSTAYVSTPISAYEVTLRQIANHMRVCVEIGEGNETIRGIAASEPILSEAASVIMRQKTVFNFNLAKALSELLTGFSINLGDRGELLVAAFFTWARDTAICKRFGLGPVCSHLSVKGLFSSLFSKATVKRMSRDTPSICPSESNQRTLGEVASIANMHFNHFI